MVRQLLLFAATFVLSLSVKAQQQVQDEIRKSIFFGGGSYYVDEIQIKELYHWLDSIPNLLEKYDIHLISHTDPIGGKEYNEWLSKMRSEAVEQIILHRGDISEHKISIKDWGLDNPVYSNTSYQGMQMNRRVDVILYPIIF
jgi:outer membrane protein OmpA-like peptidoglycan-associated protein